jgi:hypothetical protein
MVIPLIPLALAAAGRSAVVPVLREAALARVAAVVPVRAAAPVPVVEALA